MFPFPPVSTVPIQIMIKSFASYVLFSNSCSDFLSPARANMPAKDLYDNPPSDFNNPFVRQERTELIGSSISEGREVASISPTAGLKSDNGLIWHPLCVMGTFKDAEMNLMMFCNLVLPSGVCKPSDVKFKVEEDSLYITVAMPALLGNGYALHKDTFAASAGPRSAEDIGNNLRVSTYNKALAEFMTSKGEKVWWTAMVDLPATAATTRLDRCKILQDSDSLATVACIDMLVKDSNDDDADKTFEVISIE